MRRFSAALLAGGLLAGCASVPPEQLVARHEVRDFALEARFALRVSLPDRPPESSAVDSTGSTKTAGTAS